MENLSNNQELLQSLISSFILLTLMFDSGGIWQGEIRCQSLLGVKLLNTWSFLISVKLFAGLSAACVALGFDPFCWVKKYPCQRANNEALLTDDLTFF